MKTREKQEEKVIWYECESVRYSVLMHVETFGNVLGYAHLLTEFLFSTNKIIIEIEIARHFLSDIPQNHLHSKQLRLFSSIKGQNRL